MTTEERNALVLEHLPIAGYLARKFVRCNSAFDFHDAFQEAVIGLIHAVAEWNPSLGNYKTMANWRIQDRFRELLAQRLIRIPQRGAKPLVCVSPEDWDSWEQLGVTIDIDDRIDLEEASAAILSDAQRKVLLLAVQGYDLPMVAKELGCTTSNAWVLLGRAAAKLKRHFSGEKKRCRNGHVWTKQTTFLKGKYRTCLLCKKEGRPAYQRVAVSAAGDGLRYPDGLEA